MIRGIGSTIKVNLGKKMAQLGACPVGCACHLTVFVKETKNGQLRLYVRFNAVWPPQVVCLAKLGWLSGNNHQPRVEIQPALRMVNDGSAQETCCF
jgi:hypothetical protein